MNITDTDDVVIVAQINDVSFVAAFTLSSADVLAALQSNSASVVINGADMAGTAFLSFASALDLSAAGSINASLGTITLGSVSGATTFTAATTMSAGGLTLTAGDLTLSAGSIVVGGSTTDGLDMGSASTVSSLGIGSLTTGARGLFEYDRSSGDLTYKEGTKGSEGSALFTVANDGDFTYNAGDVFINAGDLFVQAGTAADPSMSFVGSITTGFFKETESALANPNTVRVSSLGAAGLEFGRWTSADTDIDGLISGTATGAILMGLESGHITVAIRENEALDGFQIISGNGNWSTDTTWDLLCFEVKADGATTIGGALNHDGATAGFYATAPVTQDTGVAVTIAAVHASLVRLGLITA